jgi:hypothetical protein
VPLRQENFYTAWSSVYDVSGRRTFRAEGNPTFDPLDSLCFVAYFEEEVDGSGEHDSMNNQEHTGSTHGTS